MGGFLSENGAVGGDVLPTGRPASLQSRQGHLCTSVMSQEADTVSHGGQWGQVSEEGAQGPWRRQQLVLLGQGAPPTCVLLCSLDHMDRCPCTRMATGTLDDINHSN